MDNNVILIAYIHVHVFQNLSYIQCSDSNSGWKQTLLHCKKLSQYLETNWLLPGKQQSQLPVTIHSRRPQGDFWTEWSWLIQPGWPAWRKRTPGEASAAWQSVSALCWSTSEIPNLKCNVYFLALEDFYKYSYCTNFIPVMFTNSSHLLRRRQQQRQPA